MSRDFADQASDLTEFLTGIALQNAKGAANRLRPTGYCHNCDEPLGGEPYFCDGDCRDDWEKRERNRK
ncbi:hypothetical protein DV711_06335 [Motiliproteus coralliicola]|uniref:DUF2116 family Zn-ribbon domain-containing protein n=1 Tax=Motiliproteus coralliicola TaxID=2283196 RepID=A0A369WU91_9GAMM|nr:hypothetical protein DV711_06335 [Motiliproteus coralliicola]